KGGEALGGEDGGEHSVTRPRAGVQNSVGVGDEPAQVGLLKDAFQALRVSAFRKPDAARFAAKASPVMVPGNEYLGAQGGRMIGQQRQQCVRGGAGDYLQPAVVLELSKLAHQVAAAGLVGAAQRA